MRSTVLSASTCSLSNVAPTWLLAKGVGIHPPGNRTAKANILSRASAKRSRTTPTQAELRVARSRTAGSSGSEWSCHTSAPGSRVLLISTVSQEVRSSGIGNRLCADLELIARRAGDTEIVVTATPSGNTVRFYLGRGYQPMAQPLPELLKLEPEDIHMGKVI